MFHQSLIFLVPPLPVAIDKQIKPVRLGACMPDVYAVNQFHGIGGGWDV